jgi:hypothetical protein
MTNDNSYIRQEVGWDFWFQWTLVSLGGWVAGAFAGQLVSSILGMVPGLAVAGAVVGLAQWFVLRGRVNRAGWWIAATAVGVALAGRVGGVIVSVQILRPETDRLPYVAVTTIGLEWLLIGGILPGLCQWPVLRRWVGRAGWWIPGSALAWAAGIAVTGWLVTGLPDTVLRGGLDGFEAIVAGMTLTAALTGLLLRWLLQRLHPAAHPPFDDRWGSLSREVGRK